jgi:drug/metabolite transporter (DMT)-like permease
VGSTRASFITYLIPVVALVLGVTFRGDEVVPLEIIGIAFVIAGALFASRRVAAPQSATSAGRISPIEPTSNQSA